MELIIPSYKAIFFNEGPLIEASTTNVSKLLPCFADKGFIPSTGGGMIQEITVDAKGAFLGMQKNPKLLLQLTDQTRSRIVSFHPNQWIIQRENITEVPMCTAEDFIKEASDIISKLTELFPRKGTRVSYVTKVLLPEFNNEEMNNIYPLFFNNSLKFYSENIPVEWYLRNISRKIVQFGNHKPLEEKLNVITDIKRLTVLVKEQDGMALAPSDRVELSFDINTFQEKIEPRLEANHFDAFLVMANNLANEIREEVITSIKSIKEK